MHAQESQQARHRAAGGRGYGREAGGSAGPVEYTPPRREGGRHRAPEEVAAAPSTEFANVPMQQRGSLDSPPSGFRRVPPFPTTGPASAPVPVQGGGSPDVSGGPRRMPDVSRSPHPSGPLPAAASSDVGGGPRRTPDVSGSRPSGPLAVQAPTEDEPVTVPVRRADLDRTRRQEDRDAAVPRQRRAAAAPVAPALRPLAVRERPSSLRPGAFGTGTYGSSGVGPARPRTAVAARQPLPWERPVEGRLGLIGTVVGAVGVLLGLAPWSGLLPRVMPAETLGSTPLFSLIGALCGVAALGIGAFAMFRADGVGRALLLGVGSACLGAAAVVVGLTL
ncbi:hypothetical protein GCM10023201_37220 [Actinomycetospora corticicola]|uniref:Uncharacterized protein n=1 Tax=Actinomycetospora corticicola TaxID=663602 RepID=A0A7Y9DZ74_9PSEU|nr:hypothetical protein [Actinomycetospora corticicola]NYD38174.1 hypothetical protein [Actinomycetospora corticicola]